MPTGSPKFIDAFLLSAAVEFCDRTHRRPALGWSRDITLSLPVHDPCKWNQQEVQDTLHEALEFLTGDCWHIAFTQRQKAAARPQQGLFKLTTGAVGVIPFSEGLDSNAVGALLSKDYGKSLVRVRLGKKKYDQPEDEHGNKEPFTAIPYKVRPGGAPFRGIQRTNARFQICNAERASSLPCRCKKSLCAGKRTRRTGSISCDRRAIIRRFS